MLQLTNDTPIGSLQFAAFDFETTGMDPLRDRIIEVGITVFQKDTILKTFHSLVNPGIPISKEAYAVHGISEELLKDKPSIAEILPDILNALSDSIPAAHNASFDLSFLLEAVHQQNLFLEACPIVDTCRFAKNLYPEFPTHRLDFLVQRLGIQTNQSHRALSDSNSCFVLFGKSVALLPLKWETPWETFRATIPGILSLDANPSLLPEKLIPLQKAMPGHERLLVSYRAGNGAVTQRELTPVGFSSDGRKTVLIAYCHLRQGTRTFRLDRIMDVAPV